MDKEFGTYRMRRIVTSLNCRPNPGQTLEILPPWQKNHSSLAYNSAGFTHLQSKHTNYNSLAHIHTLPNSHRNPTITTTLQIYTETLQSHRNPTLTHENSHENPTLTHANPTFTHANPPLGLLWARATHTQLRLQLIVELTHQRNEESTSTEHLNLGTNHNSHANYLNNKTTRT